MQNDNKLRALAQAYGIQTEYNELSGALNQATPDTLRALLGAMGVDASNENRVIDALSSRTAEQASCRLPFEYVVRSDQPTEIHLPEQSDWQLVSETGEVLANGRGDPHIILPALPVGYAVLTVRGKGWSETVFIPIRPARAPIFADKTWGWVTQLYGLRSRTNGGLGNYRDLAVAAQGLARGSAAFLGINPVHALGWAETEMISPYSPSHRGFFNTDHIATSESLGPTPCDGLIDYKAFRAKHRATLKKEFITFETMATDPDRRAFEQFLMESGTGLADFALFESLSELYGGDFRAWPAGAAADRNVIPPEKLRFHSWLQWRAELQIGNAHLGAKNAGLSSGLYLDLAVGARRGGAEVWMNRDTVAQGVSVGAPPDYLSPEGQSWDLAAYAPNKMAEQHYAPFRTLLAKLMRHCGLLRIDHALGLFRSFWIPDDGSPGAYVRQSFDTLLAIVAIEAHRQDCVVVGEDLGLVPDGFREKLNGAGLYSYSVWQYETYDDGWLRDAKDLQPFSLSCFGTHDTPTVAGFWAGRDLGLWKDLGWLTAEEEQPQQQRREHQRNSLRAHCSFGGDIAPKNLNQEINRQLISSPASIIACQLDDAFGVPDAQNLPGTVDEYHNWRLRCPEAVENLRQSEEITRVCDTMASPVNAS